MLNTHVQTKRLSFYQMEEIVFCSDLITFQNSSLKGHSKPNEINVFYLANSCQSLMHFSF